MASTVTRTVNIAAGSGLVVDLGGRRTALWLEAFRTSAGDGQVMVRPVVVEPGQTVPPATTIDEVAPQSPDAARRSGLTLLAVNNATTIKTTTVTLGQTLALGTLAGSAPPIATHVLIWCISACNVNIIAE